MKEKCLIVYYSLEGNTDFAAGKIAAITGGGLLRLQPKKAYASKGFRKFFWGGKSAVMAETPALEPYSFDKTQYDRVIIGFPVWAGNITPPIRTFLKENDLSDMRVSAFACQSGAGAEKAFQKLKECSGIRQLDAELILIDPLRNPSEENDRKIQKFCEEVMQDK